MKHEIRCVKCNLFVEESREVYAIPTCYACLPPPEPLPIAKMNKPVISSEIKVKDQVYVLLSDGEGSHIESKTLAWDTGIVREIGTYNSFLVEFRNLMGNLYSCLMHRNFLCTESEAKALKLPKLPKKIKPPKEKKKRQGKPLSAETARKFKEHQEKVSLDSQILDIVTNIGRILERDDRVNDYLISNEKIIEEVTKHYIRTGWTVNRKNNSLDIWLDDD